MSVERESISPNKEPNPAESKEGKERLKELKEAGERSKHEQKDNIEQIRSSIEKTAISGKEASKGESDEKTPSRPTYVNRDIKEEAYQSTLKDVRKQLKPTQKFASRIIHNPVVESVSEVGSKTVARPSAMLGAGVFALISTSIAVIASRYYGFRYNFFVLVISLAIGFILGLLVELILQVFRRRSAN